VAARLLKRRFAALGVTGTAPRISEPPCNEAPFTATRLPKLPR
jgi:hypothetical protein